MLDLLITFVL